MRFFSQLDFVQSEIASSTEGKKKPETLSSTAKTIAVMSKALLFAFREKEIFVFAVLQWLVIFLTYYLWVQMLDWIPEEVWRSTKDSDRGSVADWVLLIWSFVCVGIAAYPIGILSGCMGAAHLLHRLHGKSTITRCLRLTLPRGWPLWAFHWIDGWYTVSQILERLPSKDMPSPRERRISEALYYSWKLGVAGMLPGLVSGQGLVDAGKNSVKFVVANFVSVATIRLGYSALCSIVGTLTYVGAVLFIFNGGLVDTDKEIYGQVYSIYVWVGLPAMAGVGVVMMFLRPFYILAICELYYRQGPLDKVEAAIQDKGNGYLDSIVAFTVLILLTLVAYLYRNELGIVEMLSVPYGQEW